MNQITNYKELLVNAIEKYKNKVAFKFLDEKNEKQERTFQTFVEDIKAFATSLLKLGYERKNVIVIGANSYKWGVSYMGITTGNMVVVPLDKALPENEIENLVKRSHAVAMVFDEKYAEVAKRIKQKAESELETLICMDPTQDSEMESFDNMVMQGKEEIQKGNTTYDNVTIDSDALAIIMFTSGTTSLSKAVMLCQRNISSNVADVDYCLRYYDTDILLSVLPIHHTLEATMTFLHGIYSGCTTYFSQGLRYMAEELIREHITAIATVPLVLENMYKKLLTLTEGKSEEETKVLSKQILGDLRLVVYGSAPMAKDTIEGYAKFGIRLRQGYGITETSPAISLERDNIVKPGSAGLPIPSCKVRIDKPNEEGIGEILVKGTNVFMAYYEDEERTKEALVDGWFYTGDFGFIDEEGFLHVTGRKKDIIVLKNGKNIYPQEIEFLLNKIEYIEESIVFAREKDNMDTMLCAKIVYNKEKIEEKYPDSTQVDYEALIWNDVKEVNNVLPIVKHVKKITITDVPFAKTTTQKVKRYAEIEM